MATYNLTQRQKDLLKLLVEGIRTKEWSNTFMDMSSLSDYMLIPMQGGDNIEIADIHDMDAIENTGLIFAQFGSKGTKRYTITQAAYDAVDQDFQVPDYSDSQVQYIGVQVQGNVGGSVQGIGYADHAAVEQIINDPEALKTEVEKITSALLDAVKADLHGGKLVEYVNNIESLKAALEDREHGKGMFQRLISALSFVNDTASSFELMAKAWPYLSVLLQLAAQFYLK